MSDTPEKVEATEAASTESTEATATKSSKKGVDLNDAAAKGKEGIAQVMGFATKLFAEDPEKGLMYASLAPLACAVLGLLSGGNPIVNIISVALGAVCFFGIKALKDKIYPKEK